MTRMNRKLEYALMALKHMSGKLPGELTSAKEVVEATGVPFDATARVMQLMASRGLLRSEHGAHGGYLIVRDLGKVSLFDLHEMILGPVEVARCLHGGGICELESGCNIQSPISFLHRRMNDFYRGLSLAELLRLKDRESAKEAANEAR
jgi:Rrf2 family transcriptional regulator, nitric oxide-sensitive transcriptional repressor